MFTATPTTAWNGGGTNALYVVVNKKTVGQQVTVSFWAKSSVTGARFHSEPQGGVYRLDTNLTTDWDRYSYTISNFTSTIYLMAVDAGTTYYLDDIKLELGNIATDWTPAPEDADNAYVKDTHLASGITDFNLVIGKTWSGKWYKAGAHWSNEPTGASPYLQFEYSPGDNDRSGILEVRDWVSNRYWIRSVS